MIHLLLVIIYLAFISLGLPDALLGSAMAVHVQGIFCSGFIFRDNIHDHSGGNDRFQPAERPSDQTVGNRQSNCGQRAADSCRAVLVFPSAALFLALCLWAVPYGLGAGSVDAALNNYVALHYKSRHMSWAALYVGYRRFRWSLHHGGMC